MEATAYLICEHLNGISSVSTGMNDDYNNRIRPELLYFNSFVTIKVLLCCDCFNKDPGCLHPTPFTVLG